MLTSFAVKMHNNFIKVTKWMFFEDGHFKMPWWCKRWNSFFLQQNFLINCKSRSREVLIKMMPTQTLEIWKIAKIHPWPKSMAWGPKKHKELQLAAYKQPLKGPCSIFFGHGCTILYNPKLSTSLHSCHRDLLPA